MSSCRSPVPRELLSLWLTTALIGTLFFVGGCDMVGLFQNDPLDDLAYTIEESQLAPGDSTILRLTNESSSPVKYDICQSWADRRTSTGWTDADIRVSDFCFLLAPRSLEPGETASASIQIDSSAVEGVYRFSTDVEIKDSNRSIFTGTFRIEPEDR